MRPASPIGPSAVLALAALCGTAGCASGAVPDPQSAADAYAKAAARGDSDALYDMLTEDGQKARSRDEVKRIVADQRAELADQAKALTAPDARVKSQAQLRFEDGEEASLELRGGRFWVTSAGALPGGARTPEEALDQLRRVAARRSYAGLMRVLTPRTRAAIEDDLRSLVEGLERPDTLGVQVKGDAAMVDVPGGHHVRLRREGGIWRVEDFD